MLPDMLLFDFVEVHPFPAVVQLAHADALRQLLREEGDDLSAATQEQLREFVEHYFIGDEHNRRAMDALLQSLAQTERGHGFFLNGVYGSGKSHLLALVGLLCEFPAAREFFLRTHPEYATLLTRFDAQRRLVVHFSLDDYSPKQHDLETIFWRETEKAWSQWVNGSMGQWREEGQSRAEQFASLQEVLRQHGFSGAVWLMDELSMFLGARAHQDLQADTSFLQFLGQRAQRGSFWVVTALQKTVEDIAGIDPYSVAQIRDRFRPLTLSLTHVRTIVERKLIVKKDKDAFHRAVAELHQQWTQRFPHLDFGRDDVAATFPFHPTTIDCLESVVSRFFSRTRSAVQFVQEVALDKLTQYATRNTDGAGKDALPSPLTTHHSPLTTLDSIYDFFLPDITTHPELRLYHEHSMQFYEANVSTIAPGDEELALRLVKALIVFRIGGVQPSVVQLTNALLADSGLPGEGNYGYVQTLLEAFRTQGNYVVVERREGAFQDVYTLDLGARLNETLRRRVSNVAFTLEENDARIGAHAFASCTQDDFPLARFAHPAPVRVWWLNTERILAVQRTDARTLDVAALTNLMSLLQEENSAEDVQLFIGSLFHVDEQRDRWLTACRALPESRWKWGLVALLPRPLRRDELSSLREATAASLLMHDPELQDNRRGRALLERLRADASVRDADTRRLARQLFFEGEILVANAAAFAASELASADEGWNGLANAVANTVLPQVFPEFEPFAPRLRLMTWANANAIAAEILQRDEVGRGASARTTFPPSLERAVRALAVPLGVATERDLRFTALHPELKTAILQHSNAPTLRQLESALRKSALGLPPELTQIALATLLREGEVVAMDAQGSPIAPQRLALPLRESVAQIQRGSLLSGETWTRVCELGKLLLPDFIAPSQSLEEQERIFRLFARWKLETTSDVELTQARLAQIRRQWQQSPVQWAKTYAAIEHVTSLLNALDETAPASVALQKLASLNVETLKRSNLQTFQRTSALLAQHQSHLLDVHNYLTHPDLTLNDATLAEQRQRLLKTLSSGESLLEDVDKFLDDHQQFHAAYVAAYSAAHAAAHAAEKFLPYSRTRETADYRAVAQIAKVTARACPEFVEMERRLERELSQWCQRADFAAALALSPTCSACRLKFGESVRLTPLTELAPIAQECRLQFLAWVNDSSVAQRIQQDSRLTTLLHAPLDASAEVILELLTDDAVSELNALLAPTRRVTRRLSDLRERLAGKRLTKAQAMQVYQQWLDGGEPLRAEDEVWVEGD
jgi:hypothetical protein